MPRRWSWRLRGDSSSSAISCTINLGAFQLERPPWDGVTWEGVCVCSDGRKTFAPGQETSMARRGPRVRTHFAGTRRTLSGTSQGAPWGEASPLGKFNWIGTSVVSQKSVE